MKIIKFKKKCSYHRQIHWRIKQWPTREGGFPNSSAAKESSCNSGDPGLIPGSGRFPGEGLGYPLQYSWASLPARGRPRFDPWVGKIPWRRAWQPTQVFLPEEPPRTEETGGLQSMGSQRVRHDLAAEQQQFT